MKTPTKSEIVIAVIIALAWFYVMLLYTHYDLERAGNLTIGAVVGTIFALFGYSINKSWKNTGMIVGVSVVATIVYDIVAWAVHNLN